MLGSTLATTWLFSNLLIIKNNCTSAYQKSLFKCLLMKNVTSNNSTYEISYNGKALPICACKFVLTNPESQTHSHSSPCPSFYRHAVKSPEVNVDECSWEGTGSGLSGLLLADACTNNASSMCLFQPTHTYFQHQGIFSTSHWWTAPIQFAFSLKTALLKLLKPNKSFKIWQLRF